MLGHKLWYKSWHQMPAASLPDDEDELCYLAELGFDRVTWDGARDLTMHGWIKCNDGRLYHPVVAEEAREAWARKLKKRHMTYCAGVRKHNERHPEDKLESPKYDVWEALGRPEKVTDMSRVTLGPRSRAGHAKKPSKGQGQGQGQGHSNNNNPSGDAASRGTRLPNDFVMPEEWKQYALKRGHSQATVDREAQKFTLHFQTKTGRDATKINWERAWQKWALGIRPDLRDNRHDANGKEYLGV
jgi:hypothetical protein